MVPKSAQKAFPEFYVDVSLPHPPVLFVHSKDDAIVPLSESLETHRQLKEAGVRTEIFLLGKAWPSELGWIGGCGDGVSGISVHRQCAETEQNLGTHARQNRYVCCPGPMVGVIKGHGICQANKPILMRTEI